MRMIDADGHVLEQLQLPPEVFGAFLSRLSGGIPMTGDDPAPTESSHAELMYQRPGGSQPGPRLVDMDADGIDMAVLYPTTPGLSFVPDADVVDVCTAYNDWLQQYCSAVAHPVSAWASCRCRIRRRVVTEMERESERGFKAVMIRPAPYIDNKKLLRPRVRPVLGSGRSRRGCPIGVTRSRSPTCPGTW